MRVGFLVFTFIFSSVVYSDGYQSYSDEQFPISPNYLSLGKEPNRDIEIRQGVPPFFIFGADQLSLEWVQANSEYFKERGAIGYLVEALDESHISSIRRKTGYKSIFLLSSDQDIGEQLAIKHYPVFLDFEQGVLIR